MNSFAAKRHVWPDSPNPAASFITWASAAHTIQNALDVTQPE